MAPQKGRKDRPAKPSDPVSAFGYFSQRYLEHEKNSYGDAFSLTGFTTRSRQVWEKLTAEQWKYFTDLAEQDQKRYQLEMEKYLRVDEEKKKKKPKKVKDPNEPKKPLNAFVWFCRDERPKAKGLHPELSFVDLGKELGRLWREASVEQKGQYYLMAQMDQERYQREMATYMKSVASVPGIANPHHASYPQLPSLD